MNVALANEARLQELRHVLLAIQVKLEGVNRTLGEVRDEKAAVSKELRGMVVRLSEIEGDCAKVKDLSSKAQQEEEYLKKELAEIMLPTIRREVEKNEALRASLGLGPTPLPVELIELLQRHQQQSK